MTTDLKDYDEDIKEAVRTCLNVHDDVRAFFNEEGLEPLVDYEIGFIAALEALGYKIVNPNKSLVHGRKVE